MRVKIISGVFTNIVDASAGKLLRRERPPQEIIIKPVEDEEMAYVYVEAGENIQQGNIVSLFGNKIYKSDKDVAFRQKFLGVATENGLSAQTIKVMVSGVFTMSSALSNGSVFMGSGGTILISPPSTGVSYKIGKVVNGTTLIIHDNNYVVL